VPPVTTETILESLHGLGWKDLQAVYRESVEERRAKKLSDQYDRTAIPEPEFEEREFGI
jgi:hypothetical protein